MSNIQLDDDVVLAKFINYMQKALYHRRLNYYRNFEKIREFEVRIDEIEDSVTKDFITEDILSILNSKEIYLLNLHYKKGLSYIEISKITNEKVCTLKQRRNRAIDKLKKKMEE